MWREAARAECAREEQSARGGEPTRRNSHIHTNVTENFSKTGAVLLTRLDCFDFAQYRGHDGVDLFPLDISVPDHNARGLTLDIKISVYFIYTGFSLRGKQFDAKFLYI